MTPNYPSIKELLKEVEQKNERRKKVFCPVIKDMCRIDCEAYIHPFIYQNHHVEKGYCGMSAIHNGVA